MKQLLSAVVLMLFAAIKTFGQCPNTNSGTFCPTFNGAGLTLNTITEFCEMVPGDYQEISNLVAGNTYRISFCNAGSNNPPPTAYNSFMTVYGPGGFVTFNDDFCGTNSQVEFVAPASGTYRVLCNVSGNCSATSFSITPVTITLVNAPSSSATVLSINRASTNPTNAGLVNYTVTFSGSVSGLTASNFSLTTTGGISGASVGTPTGSGTTWTVPVNTGSGNGTIRLDLANATGLSPSVTTPYTSGQVYDVDKTGPSIIIGTPSASSASCGSVTYTVTYTGASTISLVNGNITLNTTGSASANVAVSGSGTSTRTVTLNNFTGTGTLGISIAANTATDVVGNNAAAAGPSGTFTVSPPPSATISYSGSPFCNSGTANVTLSGSSGGAFSSMSGLNINFSSGEVNLATSTPGTYTVTYTIAASGGCAQFQTTAGITITSAPSATISYSSSPYCNSGTTSVTLSGSSGGVFSSTGGLNINSASGEVNLTTSTPGTYTVTYTIAASGGCSQFQTTAGITITAAPSATISYSGSPYCNSGTANVSFSGSSGGAFASTSGLNINSASGEVHLATSTPGTYTITYSIAASGGCSQFQTSSSITITAAPSATISYPGSPFCNSGTASVTLSGSSGGSFSSTGGLNINPSSGEVNLATSTPGAYTITYTIAASGGCAQFQTSSSITITAAPSATISYSGSPYCNSGTANVTLSGSSGGSFSSTSGLSINPSSGEVNLVTSTPGTYTITYSIAASGGCLQFQTSSSIMITAAPSATISYPGSPFCNSGTASVTLSGSSGGSFSSTSGLNINSASGEVHLATSTPGTYTVTYSIAASGGCSQFQTSSSITITAAPSATISYSGSPYCNSGTANVTLSGSSGGSFSSTSGLNINSASGEVHLATSTPGTYTVTYSIAASGGCSQFQTSSSITITAAPSATISYSGSPYCNSGTANVTLSGSSGGSFSSTGGLNINSASGEVNLVTSTPGTYTVTYTIAASGGCAQFQTSSSITITAAPSATISYSGSPYCNSGTANVTLSGSSGGSFSSTGGLSINPSSGEVNLATSTPGTYTVTYTIAASGGCAQFQTTAGITITAAPSATINYSGSPFCHSGTANVTLSGSSGGVFSSTGGLNINSASGEVNLATSTPGTYTVTYAIAATGGCPLFQTTGSLMINAIPNASISSSNSSYYNTSTTIVCQNAPAPSIIFTGSGGVSPYVFTYRINNGNSQTVALLNGNTAIVNHLTTTTGVFTYTLVSVQDANSCTQNLTSSSTITVNPLPAKPTIISNGPTVFCQGESVVLTSTAASGNLWSPTNDTSPSISVAASEEFTVQVTDVNGCKSEPSDPVAVTVHPLPVDFALSGGGISFCSSPLSITLEGSENGVFYQLRRNNINWGIPLAGTESPLVFSNLNQPGTYTIIATSSLSNCSRIMSESIQIQAQNSPIAYNLTGGGTSCSGSLLSISLSNSQIGVSYQLKRADIPIGSPVAGTGFPLHFVPQNTTGAYTVVAISACAQIPMNNTVTITNVVTPNSYPITGGGSTCGASLPIGLSDSQAGIYYQLYRGDNLVGTTVSGTGEAITLGNHILSGNYTIVATRAGACATPMQGIAVITSVSLPLLFNVTGGGVACSGGVEVGLSGSQIGVAYQLKRGGTLVATLLGSDFPLSFGTLTTSGTYTIEALKGGNCSRIMNSNAVVTASAGLPIQYNLTGGGPYCNNIPVPIGLNDSQKGVYYQLQRNKGAGFVNVGTTVQGNGSAITLGSHTILGEYRVVVNTTCMTEMLTRKSITSCNARAYSELSTDSKAFAQVLPNLVTNFIQLNVTNSRGETVNASLLDISGRKLLECTFVPDTNHHQKELEISHLDYGMYFLRVNTNQKHITLKVVKTK